MKLFIPLTSLTALLLSPLQAEWYDEADFGPAFVQTWGDYYQSEYRSDSGLKGILLRPAYPEEHDLVALFNAETLQLVTATENGVSLDNTPWAGDHGSQNKINNEESSIFNTVTGPAWADESGSFKDSREIPGHGNFEHMQYNGYYRHGNDIIVDYTVNGTPILEKVTYEDGTLRRILQIGGHSGTLKTRLSSVAVDKNVNNYKTVRTTSGEDGTVWEFNNKEDALFGLNYLEDGTIEPTPAGDVMLSEQIKGGEAIYPKTFTVKPKIDNGDGPYLVDQIPLPPSLEDSPYNNQIRTSDFDFFSDGDRAAVCTWDGDIWMLSGLNEFSTLTWKRYAAGLFEPLGLKIVDDVIHVNCRDGIYQIKDLNGDNEADHFKVFNYDVIITNNFHEFSFALETDSEGNFYFAKASPVRPGGRNFEEILKHNGTLMKLTPDGEELTVVATGLRAPGGLGVGPNGELTTGENEGTWQPCCKLNYFTKEERPVFLGTEPARHDVEKDFHEPLCYFPMSVDNSGGSQIWVTPDAKVGLAEGELIHLSYGQSAVYRVLPQELESGQMQGGVVKLPITLSSSAQRIDFHNDGSMYIAGMRGWQTNAASIAGIQRVRYVEGAPLNLPKEMSVSGEKLTLTFDTELDSELATDPYSYAIKRWQYVRGPQYGSGQFSIDNPDKEALENALKQESKGHNEQDDVEVTAAELSEDGKTVTLTIPTLKPAQQMEIAYDLETADGDILVDTIYSTIHEN